MNSIGELKIFISVGGTATKEQELFVNSIEARLKSENLIPSTIGRNTFSADSPIKTVIECMNQSSGAIIIALERTYFPHGIEKRGGDKESKLENIIYPTPWNQIEAALAYSKGLPIMVIVEEGMRAEGLLEKGYDWYVMSIKPEITSLMSNEFNGVLSSWKKKVEDFQNKKSQSPKINPVDLTIKELLGSLKTSQLWSVLVALAAIIGGAFAIGAKFFSK